MVFTLIKNELIKILKRGKTWVVFGLFVAFLGLMALGNYFAEKNMNKYNSPEFRLENINHEIEFAQKDYDALEKELKDKDSKKLEEVKAANTLKIENLKAEKTTLEAAIKDPSKSQDLWKTQLTEQITNLEQQLKDETQPERYKAQIQSQLKQLKYLQANNIKPMTDSDFNAYNYIKIVIGVLGSFLLGLGIALFMSDIVSGECTPATLKFLLIQPVSRAKVLLSKFIAVCITTVSMIISIELIAFLVVGLVKGFGNSNYPMAFGTKFEYDMSKVQDGVHPLIEVANSTTMISLSQFTLRALLLQTLFIVSCCAFVFMISSLVKSSMISMAISTSILIAANIFNLAIAAFRKVSYFLFTSFGDPAALMTGQTASMFNKPMVTINFAIIVMLAWTIGCYLIAMFVFNKKDILI